MINPCLYILEVLSIGVVAYGAGKTSPHMLPHHKRVPLVSLVGRETFQAINIKARLTHGLAEFPPKGVRCFFVHEGEEEVVDGITIFILDGERADEGKFSVRCERAVVLLQID